jgi:UPF0176 protein
MKNILFYKFVELKELEMLKEQMLTKAKELGLLGKILIAAEGVNGCVSGSDEDIELYQKWLQEETPIGTIEFKVGATSDHTFKKMFVRIRDEIITFKQELDLKKKAPYIEPQEFKELLDSEEEVILLDARNDYESKIGKFEGAIAPNIKLFTQLPEEIDKLEEFKDKLIVTYCTGGIRCEKSSTYMVQQGFTNVKQLHGGIIRYGAECGDAHWEGKCFVFDRRGAINIDPEKQTEDITQCELCSIPTSEYHNCALSSCDKYFICCNECLETLEGCCSKECRGKIRSNPDLKAETFLDEKRPTQMQED